MTYHKLLEKQILKFVPNPSALPPELSGLLEVVSKAYHTFERDKTLSEHAFTVSEKGYQDVLQNLQVQNDIRHQSIIKLKEALSSLDSTATVILSKGDDELIGVISYLEDQIRKTKALEVELIQARNVAEKAAGAKSDFLSVMSHEIRTPLNAIIGIIHLMMQDDVLPTQTRNLKALNISAENLLNLINDILDFSKIEEGKVIFSDKNMDIREVVGNIKNANAIRAEEKGNTIRLMIDQDVPRFVKGDEVRLAQVLNNLISNAVKFTRNGRITIELSLKDAHDDVVDLHFSVIDTGIGIDAEKQKLIFERFTQANSEITREYGGSGLGLTIIKKLLHLQGSEIELESEPGKGSRFSFVIRFGKGSAEVAGQVSKPKAMGDLQGVKVLLVEDVEFNVMVAEKMLHNWNAHVEVVDNGLHAVGRVKDGTYDIVLMDLQMPILDGYSAASRIRQFNKDIPIIALTASASVDIQQKARDHGMNDYISKPFKPADLFDAIYKYAILNRKVS